jgi:hypothetical protein
MPVGKLKLLKGDEAVAVRSGGFGRRALHMLRLLLIEGRASA